MVFVGLNRLGWAGGGEERKACSCVWRRGIEARGRAVPAASQARDPKRGLKQRGGSFSAWKGFRPRLGCSVIGTVRERSEPDARSAPKGPATEFLSTLRVGIPPSVPAESPLTRKNHRNRGSPHCRGRCGLRPDLSGLKNSPKIQFSIFFKSDCMDMCATHLATSYLSLSLLSPVITARDTFISENGIRKKDALRFHRSETLSPFETNDFFQLLNLASLGHNELRNACLDASRRRTSIFVVLTCF